MDNKELEIYNKGIKEGQKHTEPSSKSYEFMEKANITMEIMKKDIENIVASLKANKEEHKDIRVHQHEIIDKIEKWMDKIEDKYTQKAQFEFWRNILVSGIFISIFLGIIALAAERLLT